jgi:hypothetical protein
VIAISNININIELAMSRDAKVNEKVIENAEDSENKDFRRIANKLIASGDHNKESRSWQWVEAIRIRIRFRDWQQGMNFSPALSPAKLPAVSAPGRCPCDAHYNSRI